MQHVQELNPPEDLPDYTQLPELPDVIPDWVLFDPIVREMPPCDCCGQGRHDDQHDPDGEVLAEPAEWAAGWPTTEPGLPAPSPKVLALPAAITALEQVEAAALPSAQALVDAALLLQLEQQLRVQDLRRIADVKGRALQLMAILPSTLEERADCGHQRRGLELRPLPDGEGWHLCGNLDLECGERLWTALRAEAARDLRNPSDTAAWEEQRRAGTDVWGIGLGTLPRSRRQRLHDAMSRLLERYLAAGLGGLSGKAPVQIHVTLTEPTVTGQTGALPARADSGRLIPRGMVRRWWCDSSVSAYVRSLGGKALRVVHAQRTLTAQERRALAVEGGGRCAGEGCCPSSPDALVVLRPHHLLGYNEDQITCLEDTIPVCDTLHHDLHDGKKTVRLRDGQYLDEHGYRDGPALDPPPPF